MPSSAARWRRFTLLTSKHGWAIGNQVISLLRSNYRRACVDHEGLRNPVDLWLAAGGRFNPIVRRVISSSAEALPYWQRGIKAVVKDPATRSIFWVAMYSGMRRGEILTLRWERVDLARGRARAAHQDRYPLELRTAYHPAACGDPRVAAQRNRQHWLGVSSRRRRAGRAHVSVLTHLYARISRAGGRKFWFHGFRNCLITIADRELTLPRSLTKRLVNHARPHRRDRGLRGRLDHRPAPRPGPTHRRPHRRHPGSRPGVRAGRPANGAARRGPSRLGRGKVTRRTPVQRNTGSSPTPERGPVVTQRPVLMQC